MSFLRDWIWKKPEPAKSKSMFDLSDSDWSKPGQSSSSSDVDTDAVYKDSDFGDTYAITVDKQLRRRIKKQARAKIRKQRSLMPRTQPQTDAEIQAEIDKLSSTLARRRSADDPKAIFDPTGARKKIMPDPFTFTPLPASNPFPNLEGKIASRLWLHSPRDSLYCFIMLQLCFPQGLLGQLQQALAALPQGLHTRLHLGPGALPQG